MKRVLVQVNLDASFWREYADLWNRSVERSPFQSPEILRYYSRINPGDTLALQLREENRLIAAVVLKKEYKRFSFLSDMKTDANYFVVDPGTSAEDMSMFVGTLLDLVKGSGCSMVLNYVPERASFFPVLSACGENSGLFWESINYSVCPLVEGETPEALDAVFRVSKEIRYRYNRLRNQQNAVFEIIENDSDLDRWVEEFCASHVLRWEGTSTPSVYRSEERRAFLLGCLEAWQKEGLLVRFAVRVRDSRVGFVIGLVNGDTLIHHSTTYHPDFHKYSPGKALLLAMSEWMKSKEMRVLDFGDGDEKYKYQFANAERRSYRIFVSGRSSIWFVFKTKMIRFVRGNRYLYKLYRDNLKVVQKKLAS